MTFTFTNYAGIPAQQLQSPFHDMIGQLLGGYEAGTKAQFLRPGLEEQLKKAQLVNKYYGPNIESQIGLRGAQAGHANALTTAQNYENKFLPQTIQAKLAAAKLASENPLLSMTGNAGQIGALLYLQQHPDIMGKQLEAAQENNSPDISNFSEGQSYIPQVLQQQQKQSLPKSQGSNVHDLLKQSILASLQPKSKQFAPSGISKLQQELKDIEDGFYPYTNKTIPIPSEQIKEDLAAPYREKLGGLEKGAHYIYNPKTHEKEGYTRPLTKEEHKEAAGRFFLNELYPVINEATKDFVGKDSVKNFIKYANEYKTNPEARKKIDDLMLAEKALSPGVVKEQLTIGAAKTNLPFKKLLESFPGSDIPGLIRKYQGYKIPGEAYTNSGRRFLDLINQATEKSNKSVPAMKTVYFHPEKHLKTKEEKEEHLSNHAQTITIRNKNTGKEETVSVAEARKRGIKNV